MINSKPSENIGPDDAGVYWADDAVSPNAPTGPSNSSKRTGSQQGQTYTSAFANWIRRLSDRWIRFIYEALSIQHYDDGTHRSSTFTPSASGQTKITTNAHASDSSTQTHALFKRKDGSDAMRIREDYASAPDIRATTQMVTPTLKGNAAGNATIAIGGSATADGTLQAATMKTTTTARSFKYAAAGFSPERNSSADWDVSTVNGYGFLTADDDTTRYLRLDIQNLVNGDVINTMILSGIRTAGLIRISLQRQSVAGQENLSTVTISGTGEQTATASSIAHTFDTAYAYYFWLELANDGSTLDVKARYVQLDWTRPGLQ